MSVRCMNIDIFYVLAIWRHLFWINKRITRASDPEAYYRLGQRGSFLVQLLARQLYHPSRRLIKFITKLASDLCQSLQYTFIRSINKPEKGRRTSFATLISWRWYCLHNLKFMEFLWLSNIVARHGILIKQTNRLHIITIFVMQFSFSSLSSIYTGPTKNGTVDTVDFCSDQQLSFFTLLNIASFSHYNNTKIIKFGWELFILLQISEARLMANPENDSP